MTYHIGQIEHANLETWGRRAVVVDGPPRWHALTVLSQRESDVERWLRLRGVYGFHPVQNRQVKIRGRAVEKAKRYLPGYVFAKFPGIAIRNRVTECPWITGAVTMQSGLWGVLNPTDLRQIHSMRNEEARRHHEQIKRDTIAPGDKVRILDGLWGSGQEVEVLQIAAGRATFKVHMFGGEVAAEADVARLRKVV